MVMVCLAKVCVINDIRTILVENKDYNLIMTCFNLDKEIKRIRRK